MKELSGLALLAAVCAWMAPRWGLSHWATTSRWLPVAHAGTSATAAVWVPEAATAVAVVGPTHHRDGFDGNATPSPVPRRSTRGGRPPHGEGPWMGGAITQRNGVWVVDLRAFPSVRTALAGTELALPGEGPHGDGYQVLRTDHHGLLAAAGIRPGDVLIGVDALPLRTPDEALDAMARLRRANRATFVFRRGSETFRVPVEVQGRPPDLELVP